MEVSPQHLALGEEREEAGGREAEVGREEGRASGAARAASIQEVNEDDEEAPAAAHPSASTDQ